jgi:uncharacterized damage-inducible protein DinB
MSDDALREQVSKLLDWEDAHVGFDAAVDGIGLEYRGVAPAGIPFSPWQILEHLRLTQHDILDFCVNSAYVERSWPKDYWPVSPSPPKRAAWDESIAEFRRDRDALKRLAADRKIDLFARIPHGTGQTYLRELVLVADHTSYHVGQLVLIRRAFGIWREAQ